jgi:hypothetical protein
MDPTNLSSGEVALIRAVYPALGRNAGQLLGRSPALVALTARTYGLRRAKLPVNYIDALGRTWIFKSSWECALARWLDSRGRRWDYERKPFDVIVLGKARQYTPDFWVYDDDANQLELLIDVKGRSWPEQERRIEAFRAQYPWLRLELWGRNCHAFKLLRL